MSDSPRISIIMAAYNSAPHIAPALDSLRRQTFQDWELIVADDGSDDETCAIVQAHAARDARIRCFHLNVNGGPAVARNAALAEARGEWVTILDSDDRYEANRLEILLARALRDDLDIIADNIWLYDETAAAILSLGFEFTGESFPLSAHALARNDGPPRIASLGHLKPFVRRAFITTSGVRYPAEARLGEDFYFLFLLLEQTRKARLISYAGYYYTLPFSAAQGVRATGTRTAYGSDGLDDLRRSNDSLANHVAAQATHDRMLVGLLRKRGNALRDEGAWRIARRHVKARQFLAALLLFSRMDVSFGRDQIQAFINRRKGVIRTVLR